jgi:hypothetical protein
MADIRDALRQPGTDSGGSQLTPDDMTHGPAIAVDHPEDQPPEDSPRAKFQRYCDDNPDADECRLYDD